MLEYIRTSYSRDEHGEVGIHVFLNLAARDCPGRYFYASGRSNSPLRVPAMNARHSERVNESTGPRGSRE
jgi:hypothetical protein